MPMKNLVKTDTPDKDAVGLGLPNRGADGRFVSDSINSSVQRDITLYTFLKTAADKLSKLEGGEPDIKRKAKLYEIATSNLEKHSQYGGKLTDRVEFKHANGEIEQLTCTIIKQRLEKFKPSL